MLKFALATLATAGLVGAQATDDDAYHPHGAVAFIRSGERAPSLRKGTPDLTALGAQQMFKLGQNLRTRYISGDAPAGLGVQHIAGMSTNTLDNNQISVRTSDEQHVVSAAQAFMQGLYPPRNIANSNGTGSIGSLLSNGSAIDYPLGGYQYANIQSAGQLDPESIYVAGSQNCPLAQRDAAMYTVTNDFWNTKVATQDFYSKLQLDWFEEICGKKTCYDYLNAIGIDDYLQYQYAHNTSIYRTLTNDTAFAGVYPRVRALANQQAWSLYGNTSAASNDPDNQAMGGKTLAAKVLGSFQLLVADKSSPGDQSDLSYPLTFMFGAEASFISLISLMTVDYHDPTFRSIPPFGSALIFELFSMGANASFPASKADLWVRFYFHNGTADFDDRQLTAFPFFGNGPSRTDMPYLEFQDLFSRIMVPDVGTWCRKCQSSSLFCWGVDDAYTSPSLPYNSKKTNRVSPTVAGVIGAIVTLVVAGLVAGLAMLFAGVRLHRKPSRKSDLGGFKGSAKLASDPDLSLVKNGALPAGISFGPEGKKGHERVGSWELRQKEAGERERREEFEESCGRAVVVEERV